MTRLQTDIISMFDSQTFVPDQMDVQHTPVYDTVTFTAGAGANPTINENTSLWFTNIAGVGKTYADTNMTQSQKLQAPECLAIMAIRLRYSENVLYNDIIAIQNQFAFELWLGNKCYQRMPLWMLDAGGGISGFTTQTNLAVLTNGVPSREAVRSLAIPLVIENQMSFYARLVGTPYTTTTVASNALATGIRMTLVLDGYYARGVQ